jgi:diamine N-acetyltransferase
LTTNEIRIREAGKSDADLIADFSRETFYDAVGPFNTKENMDQFMSVQFSSDKLIAEVSEKNHIFLLAYLEDQVAGYVKLRENEAPEELGRVLAIEIARIYVARHAKGLGLGRALVQRCLDIAKAKRKEVIWLGVWQHNQKAIGFYNHLGFERFGQYIFMLGNDPQTDWLMKKTLGLF